MKIIDDLKAKDRSELESGVKEKVDTFRNWTRDNGEFALMIGFVGGMLLVLFFKQVFLFLVLGVLASYIIWYLSDPNPTLRQEPVELELPADPNAKEDQAIEAEVVEEPSNEEDTGERKEAKTEEDGAVTKPKAKKKAKAKTKSKTEPKKKTKSGSKKKAKKE